ncbi:GntR family transcriptional regulator [Pararcticibacter amylolyticus]|uniref:GntR family transcriptional regulator n=1 Tax=Pararcticibacter amylolyticus TaxID=2173175 RepID=A0A2U2PGL0_9SPHI|nr:GntR family transcriptional regulator [Pararcticibacter amylolyticus]PWG80545.1 GntR family transcriptional regulator [Pararcticibacter amylolyticus]
MNSELFNEIRALEDVNSFSKHEKLVQGIINAIDQKIISRGDMLPSVNQMIRELTYARETIVKAYKELINRGIVESKNRRGYFVSTEDTEQHLKVCLLLFAFDTFQETFYQSFRNNLGENVHLDIFFHHNNPQIFETIVRDVKGKYGMYVIAPIPQPQSVHLLEELPMNKFLMVDRYLQLKDEHSYIVQEFEESSYEAFAALAPRIKEFKEFVFLFKPSSAEPDEVLKSYKKFIKDFNINGTLKNKYEPGSIEPGKVYFTIHNLELWQMLKDTKNKGMTLGKDLGILSHNDDYVKEIIFDGITTFSIDFANMGKMAAEFVLSKKPVKLVMKNELIRRNSL